jgi:DNA-binding transcriptional MerR regulator
MNKSAEAFRTIGEVADELKVPKHVLRFWEGKFPHIRPMKRGGGRRYYRPEDMELLRGIRHLLHAEGYTIKGVQKILREQGVDEVKAAAAAARSAASSAKPTKPQKSRARAGGGNAPGSVTTGDAVIAKSISGAVTVEATAKSKPAAETANDPAVATAKDKAAVATAKDKAAVATAKDPAVATAKHRAAATQHSSKDIVAAAIRELEICRRLLAGGAAKAAEADSPRLRAARS